MTVNVSVAQPQATGSAHAGGYLSKWSSAGARDLIDGAQQWRLWYLMGSADMRRRYARSKLGQAWIMLSSAIMISSMGFVWSFLWNQPVREMLPFVAVGMIVWQLLSGVLTEATSIVPANAHYFHNQYMPASTVILSLLYRHGVIFGLNMIFPLALAVALGTPLAVDVVLAIPGLILFAVACFWVA